jgi:predicted RNA polymerase sigma factor
VPAHPRAWLVGVARHKALDRIRREAQRPQKEAAASLHPGGTAAGPDLAEGPSAGLVILDRIAGHPQLRRWPQLHLARADLLRRLGRTGEALDAYRTALELEPPAAERAFIRARLESLAPVPGTGDEPGTSGGRPGTG